MVYVDTVPDFVHLGGILHQTTDLDTTGKTLQQRTARFLLDTLNYVISTQDIFDQKGHRDDQDKELDEEVETDG